MNRAYDMLMPQPDEEVIEIDLTPQEEIIEVDLSSDVVEILSVLVESISLDGKKLDADKYGNIDIPVGVGKINERIEKTEKDIANTGVVSLPPMTEADKGKVLVSNGKEAKWENVINAVSYQEVDNSAGGKTVVIGG